MRMLFDSKNVNTLTSTISQLFDNASVEILFVDDRYGDLTFRIDEMSKDMTFEQLFKLSELLETVDINIRPDGIDNCLSDITIEHVRMCEFICKNVSFHKIAEVSK